jgi:hypothetical protein
MYGIDPTNTRASLIAGSVDQAANAKPEGGAHPRSFKDEEEYANAKAKEESPSDKSPPLHAVWDYVKAHAIGSAEDKEKASREMDTLQRAQAEERMHEYRKEHRDFHGRGPNPYKD